MDKLTHIPVCMPITRRTFARNLFLTIGGFTLSNAMNVTFASSAHTKDQFIMPFTTKVVPQYNYVNVWSADNRWLTAKFMRMEHRFIHNAYSIE